MDKITVRSVDFLSDDTTLAADSSTLVSTQHATKQFITDYITSTGIRTFATVAVAETSTGTTNNICYVVENDTFYRYTSTGAAYTDDNKWILSTGNGGDTRWIGVAGKYNYTTTNVFEGTGALDIISSGTDNIAIGYRAAHLTSTGSYVIAIGTDSLYNNTASGNLAIGYKAGESVTTNDGNIYIGYSSGRYSTGQVGTFIGYESGKGTSGQSTGNNNIGIGYRTLTKFTTGASNVAVGVNASNNQTTASFNTNIGTNAGCYGIGGYNTSLGCNALLGVSGQTSGTYNVAIGYAAAMDITTATYNIVIGASANENITIATDNITIGYQALYSATSTGYCVAIGSQALYNNTIANNLAIGYKAGEANVSGSSLVYIGYTAGRYATGIQNVYIGDRAGRGVSGQSTGTANTAIGATALYLYTTGHDNTAIGLQACQSLTTGNFNTCLGVNTGWGITTAHGNMLLGSYTGQYVNGNYNTYIGYSAGFGSSGSSTGVGNVGIGYSTAASNTTGNYNISIGYKTALALQTCTDLITIGSYAGGRSFGSDTGSIFIGYASGASCVGNGSNVLIGYNTLNNGTTNNTVAVGYEAFKGSQGTAEVTNITVNSATIANYVGDWYRFYSAFGNSYTFDFWFDTTGSDTKPAGANGTVQTKITITGLTTVNQIATAIATAMNGMTYRGLQIFSSSSTTSPAIITCVDRGLVDDPVMTNASELSATVTTQGTTPASGSSNVYIGSAAGYSTTSGYNNVYIGYQAGYSGTLAYEGVSIGYKAGYTNTTQTGSIFIGGYAGQYATNVCSTFIGYEAGKGVSGQSSGQSNTFIGYGSGKSYTTGANNTCVGVNSGLNLTTGQGNVLIGIQTSSYGATGNYNTVIGGYANGGYSYLTTTVGTSVLIGYNSGYYAVSSSTSVFIGNESGYNTQAATGNVFIGSYSGRNATANNNIALGYQTYGGVGTSVAYEHTRVSCVADVSGSLAGKYFSFSSITTTYWLWYQVSGSGSAPTPDAGQTLVQCNLTTNDTAVSVATKTITAIQGISGSPFYAYTIPNSVYVYIVNKLAGTVTDAANGAGGLSPAFTFNIQTQGSGTSTTATNGIAIGTQALGSLTSGSSNVAVGHQAGYSVTSGNQSVLIGYGAGYSLTTATGVVNIGYQSGQYSTGANNTLLGFWAGQGASGQTTGSSNTFIGYGCGGKFTTATTCVGVGSGAADSLTTGISNTFIGASAGAYVTTGGGNTFIGRSSGSGAISSQSLGSTTNLIAIGYQSAYNHLQAGTSVYIGNECGYNTFNDSYNVAIGHQAARNVVTNSNISIGYRTYGGDAYTASHETTRITAVADVSGSLAGKYFSISSTTTTYWLWYQVSGSGTAPTPSGGETLVQVTIATNDTAATVASATVTALLAISGTPFFAYINSGTTYQLYAIVKLAGSVTNTADGIGGLATGFSFSTSEQGSGVSTTATEGVAVGHQALTALTSGSYNTALGYRAGDALTTGTKNIFIGHSADTTSTGLVNSIIIGYGASTNTNNQIYIGNTSTGSAIIKGIYGNTNGTNSYVRIGSDGTLYQDNNLLSVGYIYGLTTSNDTDAAHDIAIAAGGCRDSSNTVNIILSSPTVKQIDASWAVGSGAGGLFSGTVGNNTWYYVFVIRKDSDGSIDAGFDTSITAANKPAGYTYYRRVGAVLTDGSANIIKFIQQNGNEFIWDVVVQSAYTNNPGTSRVLVTMAAPPSSIVITNGEVYCPAAAGVALLMTSPSATDSTPTVNLFDAYTYYGGTTVIKNIRSDSSSRIGYRVDVSSTNVTVMVHTVGWIDEF